MPVPRAGIVGAEPAKRELEIPWRAGRALDDGARMERAAAMFEATHFGRLFKLHDFHGRPPAFLCGDPTPAPVASDSRQRRHNRIQDLPMRLANAGEISHETIDPR